MFFNTFPALHRAVRVTQTSFFDIGSVEMQGREPR